MLCSQVVELRPDPAVSVIDTDVEAEVVASMETEALIRAWEAEQAANAARMAELRAAREAEEAAAVAAAVEEARLKVRSRPPPSLSSRRYYWLVGCAARQVCAELIAGFVASCICVMQAEAEERARQEAEQQVQARAQRRRAALDALPPEPPLGANSSEQQEQQPVVLCAVRLPDGSRPQRRFAMASPLAHVFSFVDAHWEGEGTESLKYQLITQFPRRTLARPAAPDVGPTLQELGLSAQELFLLDPL